MEKILNKYKILLFLVFIVHVWAQDPENTEITAKEVPNAPPIPLNPPKNTGNDQSELTNSPVFGAAGLPAPAALTTLPNSKGFDLSESEIAKFKLWPNGLIPYYIDTVSFGDKDIRARIHNFLDEVNGVTRLRFVEILRPPTDKDMRWVMFLNRRGQQDCGDHSIKKFTNEGVQSVVLGYDCMSTGGDLAEAVLAIAGVPPQHNAPNRDENIKILNENILPDKKYLFEKLGDKDWLFHNLPYDYQSAGHFHSHRYSSNGKATIEGRANALTIGDNTKLSYYDLLKLNMLYNFIIHKPRYKKPTCQKIFKKNPKYNKYENRGRMPVPTATFIDPLEKPPQYTGENSNINYNTNINKVIVDNREDKTEVKKNNMADGKNGNNDQDSIYYDENDDDKKIKQPANDGVQMLSNVQMLADVAEPLSSNQRILIDNKKRGKKGKNLVVDKMSVDLTNLNDSDKK